MLENRFLRFLAAGGIAAGVNVASRFAFNLMMPYALSICLAYLIGMSTAFILARLFVFDGSGGTVQGQYARFAAVNAVAFAQVWLVSMALARFLFPVTGFTWHPETLAHILGVLSPIVTSYAGHKHFSFAPR